MGSGRSRAPLYGLVLRKVRQFLLRGCGNNSELSFWFDKWLDKGTLRSQILGPLNKGEESITLKDVVSFFGWNLQSLSFPLPTSTLLNIKATPISFSNQRKDCVTWIASPNGDFKLKDAYHLANGSNTTVKPSAQGAWVWKIPVFPKVKYFLWQCCHFSILVCALLAERGMDISPICPMCNFANETIIHALRDCPKAQDFWNSFSPPMQSSLFYGNQLTDWLRLNCKTSKPNGVSTLDWSVVFPVTIWNLWLQCNTVVFGKEAQQRSLRDVVLTSAAEFAYLGSYGTSNMVRAKIQVKWLPLPLSWFKLNSDGSLLGNPGLAGGGGLIWSDRGEWVRGYARAIGTTSSLAAEPWVLKDGIRLCISLKLAVVEIKLDAKVAVELLTKENDNPNSNNIIVADCKEGLSQIPQSWIMHCYREANKCADALARRGALLTQDFSIFIQPPDDVALLLSLDSVGTLYDHFVPFTLEAL